ncbi:hypothetical protein ILUMI_26420 [Ignelater luminosus]|uniref:Uncharacterized protein n=1 Tax=Ignelater luminosus TaxID=2038154 RepID=A0A8K0C3T4_IGNLU|nr:hypothetical protein ILUMI_26420 [Ignelater luminosus]
MEAEQESDVLQGVQQGCKVKHDLRSRWGTTEQSIEHETNSKIVSINPLQDVNEPCGSRKLNKTPIAARQTARDNVIKMSPTDEKELETDDS